jgi:hypothetical protein
MKIRIGLLVLGVCLFVPRPVAAQSPSGEWQIPQIECGAGCMTKLNVDGEGNLYFYVNRSQPEQEAKLYVIRRGTNQAEEHDLRRIYDRHLGFAHFAPLTPQQVVVLDEALPDPPLTLLDLESDTFTPLRVDVPGIIRGCNTLSSLTGDDSIFRVGLDRVLFCSRDQSISYIHLAHVVGDQLLIDQTLEMMGGGFAESRYRTPWLYLTSSLDGKVYLVPMPGTSLVDQFASQYADDYDGTDYIVLGYDLGSSTWSSLLIQNRLERWREGEDTSSIAPFVGVDENGNLYFWHNSLVDGSVSHTDFIKYDPQGQPLWHLTEQDFGGRIFRPFLVGEDQFILRFGRGEYVPYVMGD